MLLNVINDSLYPPDMVHSLSLKENIDDLRRGLLIFCAEFGTNCADIGQSV